MNLKTLILIRHGQTEWADAGRVAGHSDIDLSDSGRQAVRSLAASLGQVRPQAWYCSPMRRTRETSALLRERGPDEWPDETFDERLKELDFGDWEGQLWSEVYQHHGDLMRDWGEDWVNRSPPGGERFRDQAQRCARWLSELEQTGCQTLVAVSHAGSIRALICHCLGWPLERAMSVEVNTASVCVLERQGSGQGRFWLARSLNASRWPEHLAGSRSTPD